MLVTNELYSCLHVNILLLFDGIIHGNVKSIFLIKMMQCLFQIAHYAMMRHMHVGSTYKMKLGLNDGFVMSTIISVWFPAISSRLPSVYVCSCWWLAATLISTIGQYLARMAWRSSSSSNSLACSPKPLHVFAECSTLSSLFSGANENFHIEELFTLLILISSSSNSILKRQRWLDILHEDSPPSRKLH